MRKYNWPDTLLVWDNDDEWDGVAIDCYGANNEDIIQAWLDAILDCEADASAICNSDCWAKVDWNEELRCYYRPRIERANGTPIQYERKYDEDQITYLPDMYDE